MFFKETDTSPLDKKMGPCSSCKEEKQDLRDHIIKLEKTIRSMRENYQQQRVLFLELRNLSESDNEKKIIDEIYSSLLVE